MAVSRMSLRSSSPRRYRGEEGKYLAGTKILRNCYFEILQLILIFVTVVIFHH
jgi:hypothetical protein